MDGKTSSRYYPLDGEEISRGLLLFYTTVTWTGYLCKYLFKMEKTALPNCKYGDALIDHEEHTLL